MTCFHLLLLLNGEGDCLAAKLRPGNVHRAEGWEELLLAEIERQQQAGKEDGSRADAPFAKPEIYEALEERGSEVCDSDSGQQQPPRDVEEVLKRPVERPRKKPLVEYQGFLYQAAGWKRSRRVVAKMEHRAGEWFP